jgi:dihydrofolate reductase
MKCSVFIATSADGYIASLDGGVDWLHTAGNTHADMKDDDLGFSAYIDSVDCMVMGRKCMQMIASMNLTPDQWPYGDMPIYVLSHSITAVPEHLPDNVTMYSGGIEALIQHLEQQNLKHAYIDGGATINSFINLKLINSMILTQAPILLGEGIPLFGKTNHLVKLSNPTARTAVNDFVQVTYEVEYPFNA